MPAIPVTVADLREWLKKPTREDDPALAAALRAALDEWESATGIASEGMSEIQWMAIRQRVAGMEAFRGDDVAEVSTKFVDTIRRMHNSNAVG